MSHVGKERKFVVNEQNLRVYRLKDLTLQLFLTTTMTNEYIPYLGSITPVLPKQISKEEEARVLDGVQLIINLFDYVSIPSDMFTYRSTNNKYIARYNSNEFKKAIALLYSIQAIQEENAKAEESFYTLSGIFSKSGYDSLLAVVKRYVVDILIAYIAILDSDIVVDNSAIKVKLSIPLILNGYILDNPKENTEIQEVYPREELGNTGLYMNRINFLHKETFLSIYNSLVSDEFISDILAKLLAEDEQLAYRLNFKNFIKVLLDKTDANHEQAVILLISYYGLRENNLILMEEN